VGAGALAELSIVVVTWSSAPDVPALLASLGSAVADGAELIVIENGSGDATPALVRAALPAARVIENADNRGFAAAVNQGVAATARPYVLCLNPDTVVGDDAIGRALAYAAADPTIGILGCRTLNPDGSPQPTVDRFYALGSLLREALTRRGLGGGPRGTAPAATTDVDWLHGAFLLCRRDALEAVGGLDEAYHMYGEDQDLCWRVRVAGWRVVYYAGATVVHRGGRSAARRWGDARAEAALRGTLRLFRVHHGRVGAAAFRVLAGASFVVKAALWAARGRLGHDVDARTAAARYRRLAWRCVVGDAASAVPPRPAAATGRAGPARQDPRGTPTDPAPMLSIVILTWNSRALLEACLASLPAATRGVTSEVIVVDNGSRDGTWAALAQHPECVAVRNATNRGVAPARNQGLRLARGAFVALLDVDTVVAPEAFAVLVRHLQSNAGVGLAGPRLVDAGGALQYSCRRFPTVVDKVLRRLPERWGRAIRRDVELRAWDHASVRQVDYVIGACQVIRRHALERVGLLDERIFYGPEDVDLCLRMYRAGWQVTYVPQAEVTHLERRITRRVLSVLTVRHVFGLGYYFWKHGYLIRRPRVGVGS
jgi:hypothetical protein